MQQTLTIATLVTNKQQYDNMLESIINSGFNDNNTNLVAHHNLGDNVMNAFEAIAYFMYNCTTPNLVICHQDLLFIDTYDKLLSKVNELNDTDKNWAIAGNAGGRYVKKIIKNMVNHDHSISVEAQLPKEVMSLDENFLVFNRINYSGINTRIDGFHLYGFDACYQAYLCGKTCYVIDYMLQHLSKGTIDAAFEKQKKRWLNEYTKLLRGRFVETTCTRFYVSNNRLLNFVFNTKFVFFCVKVWNKRLK
jgi:hypothetical protein